MKFVLDTNILLSALIKNSLSRKIITSMDFDFFVPSFALSEISKYKSYICRKAGINSVEFRSLMKILFEYIEVVPSDYYRANMNTARKLISDKKDAPFLACALFLNAEILSNDAHFREQKKVKVLTMQEFVKKFLK